MDKYYRVIKDNFLWENWAILKFNPQLWNGKWGYNPIDDIWAKNSTVWNEYITAPIVESNPEFFQRVYCGNLERMVFVTRDVLLKSYNKTFKS